jgi:tetratricopeptide (TPR) repeat protein
VVSTERTVTGKVVAVSTDAVEIEERGGEPRKIPIDQIRDVQFGGEPQSLRAARSMLARGRAADAVEEVAKVGTEELDGAEPLVLEELEFVKAAAAGRAVLAAGSDPKDAGRMVKDFLDKHPQSHHFYDMQLLLGDLLVRADKADAALAAYATLAQGPVALKVRSAAARAGMLFDQQKFAEAMAEYETALAFEAGDDASAEQKRGAELGKARCLARLGKNADAVALVQGVIKRADPEEKELLGRAYNVLGGAYRAAGDKDQDALISFLTVDLVYNGSPDSHAEALANLAELWEKGRNPERAREARKSLQDSYPTSPWAKKVAVAEGA